MHELSGCLTKHRHAAGTTGWDRVFLAFEPAIAAISRDPLIAVCAAEAMWDRATASVRRASADAARSGLGRTPSLMEAYNVVGAVLHGAEAIAEYCIRTGQDLPQRQPWIDILSASAVRKSQLQSGLIGTTQAAKIMGLSDRHVRRLLDQGEIEGVRSGPNGRRYCNVLSLVGYQGRRTHR